MAEAVTEAATVETTTATSTENGFKSDHAKETVLADLARARTEAKEGKATAAELQKQLDAIQDGSRSEQEKTLRRAEKAENELTATSGTAATLTAKAERLEVVLLHALGEADARRLMKASDRLLGETRQDWETDVADVLGTYQPSTQRPSGNAGQGPRPTPLTPADTSPKGLIMAGLEESGRTK